MRVGGQRDLTRGPIPRHVLALALPAVMSTLVAQLYGLNDVYFAGRVSKQAQAAVSNNLFTMIALFGVVQLAAIGTLTLVSRRTGAGNEAGANRAGRQGVMFAFVLSLATGTIGFLGAPLIPRLMGMEPAVTAESTRYLRVLFLGMPAIFLPPALDAVFRARGDIVTPFFLHVLAVALNIAGNYSSVFVLGWGTTGIAASTVLSRLVWAVVGFELIRRGRVGIRLTREPGPFADLAAWRRIAKVAAPIGARTFLFGFIYLLVTRIASRFGTEVQNGLGVGIRLEGLCFFILLGFGFAASPIVGQNLGAKRPDRASRGAWTTFFFAMVPAILFTAVFLFASDRLMAAFASDPVSAGHGADYLRIVAVCMSFTAMEVVFAHSFVGAGDTMPVTLIDIPITASRVPIAWFLTTRLDLGPDAIWWTIAGTAIARGALMTLWFLRGNWKRARPDLD